MYNKLKAIMKIDENPERYELCHDCNGYGKKIYMSKFTDGHDGKLERCNMCNGLGYREKQNYET